jgi:hypothetical protein
MQSILGTLLRAAGIHTFSIMQPWAPALRAPLTAVPRPGHETNQEKNMRAAEAMVSSAPNPMKIFPIREV